LASLVMLVSVTAGCANTLVIAMGGSNHPNKFNKFLAEAVSASASHRQRCERLAKAQRFRLESELFMAELLGPGLLDRVISEMSLRRGQDQLRSDDPPAATTLLKGKVVLTEMMKKQAPGSDDGSLWGLWSLVSYWTDNVRYASAGVRMNSALFGPSSGLKSRAFGLALDYEQRWHQG
jgi:hypothetical protein